MQGFVSFSRILPCVLHFSWALRGCSSSWSLGTQMPWPWCPRRRRSWSRLWARSWMPHPGCSAPGRSPGTWWPSWDHFHPLQSFLYTSELRSIKWDQLKTHLSLWKYRFGECNTHFSLSTVSPPWSSVSCSRCWKIWVQCRMHQQQTHPKQTQKEIVQIFSTVAVERLWCTLQDVSCISRYKQCTVSGEEKSMRMKNKEESKELQALQCLRKQSSHSFFQK